MIAITKLLGLGAISSLLLGGCQVTELGGPLTDVSSAERAQFNAGRRVFQRAFTPESGLGPLFNSVSCVACHESPVPGGAGERTEIHVARLVGPQTCDPLFQQGGPVIQQNATPRLRAAGIEREQIPPGAAQARRSTPPLFGLGLVDAIPEAAILSREDPDDADGDGISGRANRAIDGRLGRFGRKAAVAELSDFNAGAFPLELGVTTPRSPVEETVNGKPLPPDVDPVSDPEISEEDLEATAAYVRLLAPPPLQIFTRAAEQAMVERGKGLFMTVKCAACHVPEMMTGPHASKALDRRPVALYSDLLLHDMGAALADICLGQAHAAEFRTEMLWGLRFRRQFLHDGRARTVTEAIEHHAGEAQGARDRFRALGEEDQKALLKFLESI